MKITESELRKFISNLIIETVNNNSLHEGIFSGALKGLARNIPFAGNIAADAHTSTVLDKLDSKISNIERRLTLIEKKISSRTP